MNSGIIEVDHNYPEKLIEDQWSFLHYWYWVLIEHEDTNIKTFITQICNSQLDWGTNSYVLTYINISTKIIYVKCKVEIINDSKSPAKRFGLAIIKYQNNLFHQSGHHNTCHKTHKTQYSNRTQTLQPIQKCHNWGTKLVKNQNRYMKENKGWTKSKERNQKLLDFITIEIIKVGRKKIPKKCHHSFAPWIQSSMGYSTKSNFMETN